MPHVKSYQEKFDFIVENSTSPRDVYNVFNKLFFKDKITTEGETKDGSIGLVGKYEIEGKKVKLNILFKKHDDGVHVSGSFKCFSSTIKFIIGILLIPLWGIGVLWFLLYYFIDLLSDKSEYATLIEAFENTIESFNQKEAPVSHEHITALKDLAELKEKDVITEEEYLTQKNKLLEFFKN